MDDSSDHEEFDFERDHSDDEESMRVFGRDVSFVYSDSEAFANAWIDQYISFPYPGPVVGLHIELDDPHIPRLIRHPFVATIAFCLVGRRVLIYHMHFHLRLPLGLMMFMTCPTNTFVGVNIYRRLRALIWWDQFMGANYFGFHIRYCNLGALAARRYNRPELRRANASGLAAAVLGERLVMPPVDLDWDRPVLLDNQVEHAAMSAYVAYEMGLALIS